jgi:outer membrane receptor for Fe3+-dicitrate
MKTFTIVSQLAVAAVLTAFVGTAASARIAEDRAEKRTPGTPDDPTGDDIVVTGQSLEETLPQELARYGSDIETVTDRQVRDRGVVDVASALESVPGLYIKPGADPFS